MKTLGAFLLALHGAAAFPAVMEAMSNNGKRQSNTCSVSAKCNQKYSVTDAQIGYNPKAPTPAQVASAGRNHCGNLTPCTLFDAAEQYVSTSGAHAFQSPKSTDLRGPCPGLNAAANHGYLARNGVQSLTQTITGLGQAYGMSVDLAGFLAAYAIAFDGDLVSMTWSIGGPQAKLGAVDSGQGISWSHNKYEGDTSISRCDAYINNGDAHSLSTTRFAYAYSEGAKDDRLDMDKFARAFAKNTYRSIGQNPYYFAPLFSTTLVSPAAYNFVIAMMSNHTADQPGGYLNEDMFKTFFSVTGHYPNYKWNPGQDRIPNNTYTGIDISNFSNGIYNAQNLFQGDNLACFMYQNIQQGLPDIITANPLVTAGATLLQKQFGIAFAGVTCPAVSKFNNNNLPPYPGRSYSPNPPANAPQNC
ncbi:hypothetical protein PRZ48_011219 [Zasmidium cellare]|uniref:Heme haloperoxidase family profile domain-containing protein n=1 Tax=Zasmidium cellare TaxID=395010 RepID=A0ABR0EBC4_ZASCE|nr:hypothetical protein PRZ48_011219 [Zasmidium cellare]